MLAKLLYESGIASKYDLKGSTFMVLIALSCHWNTKRNDAFPSQQTMAKNTNLSESSIKNGLKELRQIGFIISFRNIHGNVYKFTQKFLEEVNSKLPTGKIYPSQSQNLPVHENIEIKKENNITSSYSHVIKPKPEKDDDVSLKTSDNLSNIDSYKEITIKLKSWNVIDSYKLIKSFGVEKIQQCIKITEDNKPKNAGGYLRSLLNLSNLESINNSTSNNLGIKPYEKQNINKNEPSVNLKNNSLEHCNKILKINEKKPSKQEIIQDLINKGNAQESQQLMAMWKLDKSLFSVG